MITKTRILAFATAFAVMALYLASITAASGVVSEYWRPNNPLKLNPGDSQTVQFRLQNLPDTSPDVTFRPSLVEGQEIATLEERDYLVPGGTADTSVPVTINIPENAQVGTKYAVGVEFRSVTSGAGGGVSLGTGFTKTFDVEIVEVPPPVEELEPSPQEAGSNTGMIITIVVLLLLVVVIIVVIYVVKKKKNKHSEAMTEAQSMPEQ